MARDPSAMSRPPDPPALTLLDGLPPGAMSSAIRAIVGDTGPVHTLGDESFAPCQGCWQCWVAQPGTCKTNDAANGVMRDTIGADAVLWTTKLRFGCWSPVTKAALDRSIGLLSPFFKKIDGETHHHRRYRSYPRWGALAVIDRNTSDRERALFETLVGRNALNMHSESPWVGFLSEDAEPEAVERIVREGLRALSSSDTTGLPEVQPEPQRSDAMGVAPRTDRPRHVVLWVGSAKARGTSTSESLGGYLVAQLADRGWTTETLHAARVGRLGRERAPKLIEALGRADLVVLASPVYVDSLPALVLDGLARVAAAASDGSLGGRLPALLPILQCGFPELTHTALAVQILSIAADTIGLSWAGHLAMGEGGMIDGQPLESAGGRVHHQRQALDAAARELDEGRPISAATAETFSTVPLSPGMYRLAGQAGWIAAAIQHGSVFKLWDRPFASR